MRNTVLQINSMEHLLGLVNNFFLHSLRWVLDVEKDNDLFNKINESVERKEEI